jgi:hypothetical protein
MYTVHTIIAKFILNTSIHKVSSLQKLTRGLCDAALLGFDGSGWIVNGDKNKFSEKAQLDHRGQSEREESSQSPTSLLEDGGGGGA